MSAEGVEKLSLEIAASEEESVAPTEQQDVACGLENLPVSLWPLGAEPRPKPFQYTPDHVAGPGADIDPTQITFPGCACIETPCVPGTCSCLRHEITTMTIYALGMWDPKESTPSQFLNAMFCASVACAAEIGWSRMAYTSFSRCSRQRKKAGDFGLWNLYPREDLSVSMLGRC